MRCVSNYDKPVTIEKLTGAVDAHGFIDYSSAANWDTQTTAFAHVQSKGGREFWKVDQVSSDVSHVWYCQWDTTLAAATAEMRLVSDSVTYEILSVIDIDLAHKVIEIQTKLTGRAFTIPELSGWAVSGATFTRNGNGFDLIWDREQYKPTTTQDYYVSYPGFGTQDGSSWANAKSIIRFAVDAANTAGVVPRIFLDGGQTHENDASMAPSMQLIGVNRGSGATPTLSSPTFVTDASYATNLYCENLIFDTVVNSAAGTRMFKNCSFANSVAANTDAAQFSGSGIVILEDCTTANRPGDGFEYTGTVSAFEIGCTAVANGDGVTVADNGSTAHGDVRIVRYNGTYTDGYRNIHDVDDVKSYLIDCTVNTSQSLSGGVAYDSFNVGCGQTESTDTTEVTIWSGNVSGGAVVDLFNDSDGTLTVYNLATYSTSSGTITAAVVG